MMNKLLLLSLLAFAAASVRYDHYSLWRINIDDQSDVGVLKEYIGKFNLDVWSDGPKHVDILVEPIRQRQLNTIFRKTGITYEVKIPNVQTLIDEENANREARGTAKVYDPNIYNTYDDNMARLDEVAAANDNAVVVSIGQTYEGREMNMIQFSSDLVPGGKPVVYIDCGIHAREWITPATCMYGVDRFDEQAPEFLDLLNTYDVHILPHVNPDGYEHTSNTRLWRKNRNPNDDVGSACIGTDVNRNFQTGWGGEGASEDPCDETYRGSSAASEMETQNVQNVLVNGRDYAAMYSIHSYGLMWMYAYGYNDTLPEDDAVLNANAQVGVEAIESVYGTQYTYGPIATTIYVASGSTVDYAYVDADITYSYTLELRDDGTFGFLLPEAQILPTGEETWTGLIAAINDMQPV